MYELSFVKEEPAATTACVPNEQTCPQGYVRVALYISAKGACWQTPSSPKGIARRSRAGSDCPAARGLLTCSLAEPTHAARAAELIGPGFWGAIQLAMA
jgi:hypothetical protein